MYEERRKNSKAVKIQAYGSLKRHICLVILTLYVGFSSFTLRLSIVINTIMF